MSTFSGLSSHEVLSSRTTNGANSLTSRPKKSIWRRFFSNFNDPMIRILLVALGIQVVFLFGSANLLETIGIAAAILVAVIVSTLSEYGSERAFEKLQSSAQNVMSRVRRDGQTILLPVTEIVVGDIVLLGSGDRIPADGVVIRGKIEVDQSVLNGESKEATKQALSDKSQAISKEESVDYLNPLQLFSGTVVTNGDATMRVTSVGDNTAYGKIARELQETAPKTPLRLKLEGLAKMISRIGYMGAALVAVSYLFNTLVISNGFNWDLIVNDISSFKTIFPILLTTATLVVSVIVMAVPEGLPMMITVVMSSNMRHMLRDNVLVRQLGGIETAGSMNILFTDKTGTLTHGKLEVIGFVDASGKLHEGQLTGDLATNLSISLRQNTSAEIGEQAAAIGGNSTDRILLEYANKLPTPKAQYTHLDQLPFSSHNKFMATCISGLALQNQPTQNYTLIKGAPEKLLSACTKYMTQNGSITQLDSTMQIQATLTELSNRAVRLIAVAISPHGIIKENPEQTLRDLILIGFIAIRDRVRSQAKQSVQKLCSAGIQTVMITGDAVATAIAVAKETGILAQLPNNKLQITNDELMKKKIVMTSEQLNKLHDNELKEILPKLRVVARALPSDKSRLVRIAQSLNLVSGMTGDGVNDAPALKKADIGFAMGSGTEVAKEAGDIVILDDNINSVTNAVSYGRTIFKSIRKFLIFKLTINFVAMSICIIAPLLSVDMPITVIQMLWINLVMDTLAGLAFGGERPRQKYMSEPPKCRTEPIINRYMWQQIFSASIFTSFACLFFLTNNTIQGHFQHHSAVYALTAFFAFFMFINIFNSFNARTHDINPTSYLALNKPFIYIMAAVTIAQIIIIYFGGTVFRTAGLSPLDFLLVIILASAIIPFDMLRKIIINRRGEVAAT
jgi:calcium-translocating P-type ATPase